MVRVPVLLYLMEVDYVVWQCCREIIDIGLALLLATLPCNRCSCVTLEFRRILYAEEYVPIFSKKVTAYAG